MNQLHLVRVGQVDHLLPTLCPRLEREFGCRSTVLPGRLDPEFALDPQRQQFHSSEIIARLHSWLQKDTWRLLAVADVDLFIPILTFVFGEAEMEGRCALVSAHRLREEFYGLPANAAMAEERLRKEAVHELGHTLGLTHCEDYLCAMSASHSLEWIDVKSEKICGECRAQSGLR